MKYRGSAHGTNEYPFLIDEQGITVLPITAINLAYPVSRELVSTGIDQLDRMLGGTGYFRGSSLLVSGTAGTGKSSIAAHFVDAACRRGEQCIYFAFEESPDQISRNMQSIGIDLGSCAEKDLLHFAAFRPTSFGLETHLSTMLKLVEQIKPLIVVLDPVSSFAAAGTDIDARAMLMRMIDFLKSERTTALLTSLTTAGHAAEQSEVGISSLIDTWVLLHNLEQAGERTRTLSIVKSRGMNHSNQARELLLTDHGIKLVDIFIGPEGGILTGSARIAQEATDRATVSALNLDIARKQAALQRKRSAVQARIAEMQTELAVETEEVESAIAQQTSAASALLTDRTVQAQERENTGDQR